MREREAARNEYTATAWRWVGSFILTSAVFDAWQYGAALRAIYPTKIFISFVMVFSYFVLSNDLNFNEALKKMINQSIGAARTAFQSAPSTIYVQYNQTYNSPPTPQAIPSAPSEGADKDKRAKALEKRIQNLQEENKKLKVQAFIRIQNLQEENKKLKEQALKLKEDFGKTLLLFLETGRIARLLSCISNTNTTQTVKKIEEELENHEAKVVYRFFKEKTKIFNCNYAKQNLSIRERLMQAFQTATYTNTSDYIYVSSLR